LEHLHHLLVQLAALQLKKLIVNNAEFIVEA